MKCYKCPLFDLDVFGSQNLSNLSITVLSGSEIRDNENSLILRYELLFDLPDGIRTLAVSEAFTKLGISLPRMVREKKGLIRLKV
jgi:hypothetical protein